MFLLAAKYLKFVASAKRTLLRPFQTLHCHACVTVELDPLLMRNPGIFTIRINVPQTYLSIRDIMHSIETKRKKTCNWPAARDTNEI